MSTQAEQAALGYFWAWLQSKADGEITVRDFGAVGNEEGGIYAVRVQVRGEVLCIVPNQMVIASNPITREPVVPQAVVEELEEVAAEQEEATGVHPVQRGRYQDPEPIQFDEVAASPVQSPLPPPAYSAGTCSVCGMFECLHGTECPYCGATGDEPCVTAAGFQVSKPHADRRRAHLQTLMERQRQQQVEAGILCATCEMQKPCHHEVGCPACEVGPGQACVSYTGGNRGRPQPRPHASRSRMGEAREAEGTPSYGGAERYVCPSCDAKRGEWCRTTSGNKKPSPHSARANRMPT